MQPPPFAFPPFENHFVTVSIISLEIQLDFDDFLALPSEEYIKKIKKCLEKSIGTDFVIFPEYSYHTSLESIFNEHSRNHGSIIIGGSAIEKANTVNDFFAYSPLFTPESKIPIKIYKRHITIEEKGLTKGKLIEYSDTFLRDFGFVKEEKLVKFSIYVCLDFLKEEYPKKEDKVSIAFVPQYEKNQDLFINHAYEFSTRLLSFVIGSNVANDKNRTIGAAMCNKTIIRTLVEHKLRKLVYKNGSKTANYNNSIIYDTTGETIIKLKLNTGVPFMFNSEYSDIIKDPNVTLLSKESI